MSTPNTPGTPGTPQETAVLFDLDGTLLDTPGAIVSVLDKVLAESGRPVPSPERVRATVGRPLAAVFAELLELEQEHGEVERSVARFRELFREDVVPGARSLIFPGVPELLERLRAQGLALAIVTSKIRPSALELLEPAGLVHHFDAVVCHGMAPRGKPHPDLALLAARELGREPGDCVVVGDAVDDMRMAGAAGMRALGVAYGVATAGQLTSAGAESVSESVLALGEALGSLRSSAAITHRS
ncbi:HAD family hydrolase [Streptomyces geranii]|uniref:HAD family hydrolase n=1 Tax=Streptomyces geranii TaxID=2058923 RepID=UPI000D0293C6|nr:HAD family hydrolase [Streptomyces geranii]